MPADILKNLEKLLNFLVKDILQAFPLIVGILTFVLFSILAILFLIFQGGSVIVP